MKAKYHWTPAQVEELRRIYAEHISSKPALSEALKSYAERLGWPRHVLKNKASQLRLCYDTRNRWTQEELSFLRNHAGSQPLDFFKKKLHRSYQSIRSKLDDLKLSYRITEGYSRDDLSAVLGVSRQTVTKWIKLRWLTPSRQTERIPEAQVMRFVRQHPEEYSLKRVDEAWFKGLVFPSFGARGPCQKEIA